MFVLVHNMEKLFVSFFFLLVCGWQILYITVYYCFFLLHKVVVGFFFRAKLTRETRAVEHDFCRLSLIGFHALEETCNRAYIQ